MAQIKIYGHHEFLNAHRSAVSDAIHAAVTGVLGLPPDKRFHRFLPLTESDFIHPADRSPRYTIIEVGMFSGRTVETKKNFIRALFKNLELVGVTPQDVEITIHESPKENWGIRGKPGDELALTYKVEK